MERRLRRHDRACRERVTQAVVGVSVLGPVNVRVGLDVVLAVERGAMDQPAFAVDGMVDRRLVVAHHDEPRDHGEARDHGGDAAREAARHAIDVARPRAGCQASHQLLQSTCRCRWIPSRVERSADSVARP